MHPMLPRVAHRLLLFRSPSPPRCRAAAPPQAVLTEAAGARGVVTIVAAMEAHLGDAGVQQNGCAALAELVQDTPSGGRFAVLAAGGAAALVFAMEAHPTSSEVQHLGCVALRRLSELRVALAPLALGGAIAVAVAAMQRNPHDAEMQRNACLLLAQLARVLPCPSAPPHACVGNATQLLQSHRPRRSACPFGHDPARGACCSARPTTPNSTTPSLPWTACAPCKLRLPCTAQTL